MLGSSRAGGGSVYISEIRIDQPGTDNDEYVEIAGPPGTPLDEYSYIVLGDGTAAQRSGVIEALVPLTGLTIPTSGFLVIAEASFTLGTASHTTTLNFENSDNVTHLLVTGFMGMVGQDLDGDDDCTLDTPPWTAIVDGVTMLHLDPTAGRGAECGYQSTIGPSESSVPMHIFRCRSTIWMIGSPDPLTGSDSPGAANPCSTLPCPADLDANGSVAVEDLSLLLGAWGFQDHPADLDFDSVVGGTDLNILLGAWGPC